MNHLFSSIGASPNVYLLIFKHPVKPYMCTCQSKTLQTHV